MKPVISIIIPTFNNLPLLKKCIASIEKQTFKDFEVLIMDGNSTDGTQDYLKTLETPFFYKSEPDTGIYDAMNKGIQLAKGEWFYFLGADDKIAKKDTLQNVVDNLKCASVDLILANIKYENSEEVLVPEWGLKLWIKNILNHQGLIYRAKLFESQQFSYGYNVLSDYHFNIQLFKKKCKIKKLSLTLAICGDKGVSKDYNWNLYSEETRLKTALSSKILWPLFFVLSTFKFILKQKKPTQ